MKVDSSRRRRRRMARADDRSPLSGRITANLCQHELLFQGREWQCHTCYNRNWVALGRSMTCEVCGRVELAPVSGDWHFRANPFVLEAYSEHNTEVPVWALWILYERARNSFYCAPSLKLWLGRRNEGNRDCDVEIDAVAVVDGKVYVLEATASAGLSNDEIDQLAIAAERIRPDTMLIACMADTDVAAAILKERLRTKLPPEVDIEVQRFRPELLERDPL